MLLFFLMQVKCYSLNGCKIGVKYTLRCRQCDITYNYAQFGDKSVNGFQFYLRPQEYVEASDTVYFCRQLLVSGNAALRKFCN